jgi:nitric oxide synthase oxygenase domain/subunit/sulfite reductase alpha subunit-like flavoprotein
MHGLNGDVSKCPMASMFESRPLPNGYTKSTELLVNGKTQTPSFIPKTYSLGCEGNVCHGSHMIKHEEARAGLDAEPAQIWEEAHDYIREYYYENKLSEADCLARLEQVKKDIFSQGYYEHTYDELSFGVKTCWRNARKCIMRSQWNTMTTIDARHITKSDDILEACFKHLNVTRNGGRIRPHVTVFPQKKPGQTGPRIWNEQLLRYAGYKMEDGSVIGDPANLELTARAIELGWKPKYGMWDILPLIVCEEGGDPVWKEIPSDCVKEIMVEHPKYDWFKDLGLRWFDHPPVSSFALSIGGVDYMCAPFSGWYMSTEIAARDLADEYRYNALPEVARRLGLSMSNRALWKDQAVIELSHAVLYSWDKAKTTMVDHHSASDSFVAWYDKEIKTRGHCPADWVWIVPPTTSGSTKVFHQEMFSYMVKPAVMELPERPWYTYWRQKGITAPSKLVRVENNIGDAGANAIVIAYGTETGNSLRYAERLQKHLHARKLPVAAELVELDDLKLEEITSTLIVVTSSYGDGEAPSNAGEFTKVLENGETKFNARYAVFGLGSKLYGETYQHFPRLVDSSLGKFGGRRIIGVGAADETSADPDAVFEQWMISLGVAIEVGSETTDVAVEEDPKEVAAAEARESIQQLARFISTEVSGGRAFYDIKTEDEPRAAYNIELRTTSGESFNYEEGDHLQVIPPTKLSDLECAQSFIAHWGEKAVQGVSVARILHEFVDWTDAEHSAAKIIEESHDITEEQLESVILSLPYKAARTYSISSTPLFRPSTLHIAIARLEGGQTSIPMVDSLRSKAIQVMHAHVHKSKFRMPVSPSTPVILVGTGTGVGPLRGMMHGRLTADVKGGSRGSITCVLGFRTPREHLYRDEFADAAERGVECFTAYSRQEGHKERVGDVIVRESNKIVHLLEQGASLYICGSTVMGKGVEAAISQAVQKTLGLDAVAGKNYVSSLRKAGRLSVDTYTRTGAN